MESDQNLTNPDQTKKDLDQPTKKPGRIRPKPDGQKKSMFRGSQMSQSVTTSLFRKNREV